MTETNNATPTELLLWCDVETTGLDPNKEQLLEVSGFITDTNGNKLSKEFYESLIFHDNAAELRANAIPYVQRMHDKSGMWDKLETGTPLPIVDTEFSEYVSRFKDENNVIRLAGNSIRLDLNFIEKFLPKTYSHLHYRSVDVSALKFALKEWGFVNGDYVKQDNHTAYADIMESLGEYLWLKEQLRSKLK